MGKIDSVARHKGRRWLWVMTTFGLVAGFTLAPDASQGDPAELSQSEVFLFGTTTPVGGGSSQLVRTNRGVTATFQTPSLEPGAVYSLWWVVFNAPENCFAGTVGTCGLGDLMNDAAMPTLLWGAGQVVGDDGVGDFGAHLRVSHPRGEVRLGPGLLDARGAEIHVVVRNPGHSASNSSALLMTRSRWPSRNRSSFRALGWISTRRPPR